MMMLGTPMAEMPRMISPSGRKPLNDSFSSWFFLTLKPMAMQQATIWPSTVAAAAPATPMSSTKMQMGSKMMFTIAPIPWEIIV